MQNAEAPSRRKAACERSLAACLTRSSSMARHGPGAKLAGKTPHLIPDSELSRSPTLAKVRLKSRRVRELQNFVAYPDKLPWRLKALVTASVEHRCVGSLTRPLFQ